jgi:hypothetical protein
MRSQAAKYLDPTQVNDAKTDEHELEQLLDLSNLAGERSWSSVDFSHG